MTFTSSALKLLGCAPASAVGDLRDKICSLVDQHDQELRHREETIKSMERRLVTQASELQRAGAVIVERRMEISELRNEIEDTNRQLTETRRQLMVRESELRAVHSIPMWTRRGRQYIRLTPGANPVDASDPLIADISKQIATALTDELYRRAGGTNPSPTARMLIARSQPYPDTEARVTTIESKPC